MFKRFASTAALGLLLSACAGGPPPEPPAPPPLDPTGTYDIVVAAEGMEIYGTMVIRGSAEAGYTGSVETDMGGATLSDLAVEGQSLTFYVPDVDADVRLVFEGDRFTGEMEGGMGFATMTGTKRSGG
jgi:hypothetical protein